MYPMMIEAMAADRARETRACAAAAGPTRQPRGSRQARRGRALAAVGRAVRGQVPARAGQSLRGPRPA
jgi:hypothetical protein